MFGRNIKEYLRAHGIKQNFVAKKVGIPATTLNSMLCERQKIDIDTYAKICDALDVGFDFFVPST